MIKVFANYDLQMLYNIKKLEVRLRELHDEFNHFKRLECLLDFEEFFEVKYLNRDSFLVIEAEEVYVLIDEYNQGKTFDQTKLDDIYNKLNEVIINSLNKLFTFTFKKIDNILSKIPNRDHDYKELFNNTLFSSIMIVVKELWLLINDIESIGNNYIECMILEHLYSCASELNNFKNGRFEPIRRLYISSKIYNKGTDNIFIVMKQIKYTEFDENVKNFDDYTFNDMCYDHDERNAIKMCKEILEKDHDNIQFDSHNDYDYGELLHLEKSYQPIDSDDDSDIVPEKDLKISESNRLFIFLNDKK